MNAFQPRALRQVNNQGTYNQVLKPVNAAKSSILNLKSLSLNGAADPKANKLGFSSRIPTLATRTRNQANQENNVPEALQNKKTQGLVKSTGLVKTNSMVVPVSHPKPVIENIDLDSNCFLMSEYVADIYKYLREVEVAQKLDPQFLSLKGCVAPHMRAILVNWIIQVHNTFHMYAETLYVAVSMIDRYFATQAVPKNRIQLVGITALFIAAKYEEIYYPEINEFVAVCDKLYTKKEIIQMELHMLGALDFQLGRPLPLHFLRRCSKAAHADGRTHMLAKYLCELMLVEYEAAHWNPSLLAATALYLSLRLLSLEQSDSFSARDNVWTPTIEHYSGYSHAEVVKHAPVICRALVNAENSKYQHCRKKYAVPKYLEISKLPQFQSQMVKRFAGTSK